MEGLGTTEERTEFVDKLLALIPQRFQVRRTLRIVFVLLAKGPGPEIHRGLDPGASLCERYTTVKYTSTSNHEQQLHTRTSTDTVVHTVPVLILSPCIAVAHPRVSLFQLAGVQQVHTLGLVMVQLLV